MTYSIKFQGSYTDVYPNALSMYLLKEGKWGIPKEHIKKSFSHRSIEYIYEEVRFSIGNQSEIYPHQKFKRQPFKNETYRLKQECL